LAEEERAEGQELGPRGEKDWFQWYTVEEGDTLSKIAEGWYGRSDERWWRRIWMANRRTIGEDPNFILPGQRLKLPYRGFSYHMVRGDTFSQIAQWAYNDGNKWYRIHEENPEIEDPDRVQAGQQIWVP
jgi:nucleoid-associated protein YgaU